MYRKKKSGIADHVYRENGFKILENNTLKRSCMLALLETASQLVEYKY